jgi:hypothetical protein
MMTGQSWRSFIERRHEVSRGLRVLGGVYLGRHRVTVHIPEVPRRLVALGLAIGVEFVLLLIALVPQSVWASHGLPDGPIPVAAAPLVAGLFYVLPAATGFLAHRWRTAVVLATLPAWLDLGLFAVLAAPRIGPYYLALEPHAASTVGTLELFAVLGVLGWLARPPVFAALSRLRPATSS